ncbi:MAG: hypothetical protein WB341_06075 [Terracidiphilus sp.]
MIRQAVSCDLCATEKRQNNHWFVAYEQAGELRISGWNSRRRLRPGAKHLCGQACLHKLVDDFMANSAAAPAQRTVKESGAESAAAAGASFTTAAAHAEPGSPRTDFRPRGGEPGSPRTDLRPWGGEPESSARLLTPPAAVMPKPVDRPRPELVTTPPRPHPRDLAPIPGETPYASRNWRAEAWERERERELRAIENRPNFAASRRSTA